MTTKYLILAQAAQQRYVGEVHFDGDLSYYEGVTPTEQFDMLIAEGDNGITLRNAYEVGRTQIMTQQGPEIRHIFLPIGLDGPIDWAIYPVGLSVIEEGNALYKAYNNQRLADSGLVFPNEETTQPKILLK